MSHKPLQAVIEQNLLSFGAAGEDFAKHLFPRAIKARKQIIGYTSNSEWLDIGSIAHYERANKVVKYLTRNV